jgi:hypothetical protein
VQNNPDASDYIVQEIELGVSEYMKVEATIVETEPKRSAIARSFQQLAHIHSVPVTTRDGRLIPQVAEKFTARFNLYKVGELAGLIFSAAIMLYLGFSVMNSSWYVVVLFVLVSVFAAAKLMPAQMATFLGIEEYQPDSQKTTERVASIAALLSFLGLIGFAVSRTSSAEEGLLAELYLPSLALSEFCLLIFSSLSSLLLIYYGWSHRLTQEFDERNAQVLYLEARKASLLGALVSDYEKYLRLPDPKPTLTISLSLQNWLKQQLIAESTRKMDVEQLLGNHGGSTKLLRG